MDTQSSDSGPVLTDLVAAGLVSHEMIGDPAQLGPEAEVLRVLCGTIAGPVYRLDPFHYAFRAGAGDLDGRLAALDAGAWTGAIEGALQAALGADAVWLNATDLLPGAAPGLDQPLLVLRAHADAVAAGLEAAPPGLQAVINARFATGCARLAAGAGPGEALDARLAAIEADQAEIRAVLATLAQAAAQSGAALARTLTETLTETLPQTLAAALQRLDAQSEILHAHIAREDLVAGRLAELSALAGTPAAFRETLGVTLAEFLARLERRAEEAPVPTRVPQFS